MVPNTPNQKTIFPLSMWREKEGPIKKKMIWLKNVIKPIVRDRCKISLRVDQALWIQVFLKTSW